MLAATYRIGPSDFFTSDDLAADAGTLDGQMRLLDDQDWSAPDDATFDAWNKFLGEWRKFYADTFVNSWFGAGWNNSNRDQLIQFENRFGEFAQEWSQASQRSVPGGIVQPSEGTKDTFGDHFSKQVAPALKAVGETYWYLVIAVVVALVIFFREPLLGALRAIRG